jgi:hypothetical protein
MLDGPPVGSGITAKERRFAGPWVVVTVVVFTLAISLGLFAIAIPKSSKIAQSTSATNLTAVPARSQLGRLVVGGQPPADIIDNLEIPNLATTTGFVDNSRGGGQYDHTAQMSIPSSITDVIAFYRQELTAKGWHVTSVTATIDGHGQQVLASKGSKDSFNWEAGVTAAPGADGDTALSLRLLQLADDN